MAIFIERKNINTVAGENGIMAQIVADMLANGFNQMYPSSAFDPATDTTVILEPDATVNPVVAQQWAIKFSWIDNDPQDGVCECFVGTPAQFNYSTGDHTVFTTKYFTGGQRPSAGITGEEGLGIIGSLLNRNDVAEIDVQYSAFNIHKDKKSKSFIYRSHRALSEISTYPMSYSLSISPRGFVLMAGEQNDNTGIEQSWIAVQRPVDNVSGDVITTGHAPVHCMYATCSFHTDNPQLEEMFHVNTQSTQPSGKVPQSYNVRRFVVREDDIVSPYPLPTYIKNAYAQGSDFTNGGDLFGVPADRHTIDYNAVMNTKQQIAITENNKYVITFPSGLNTSRFAYTHEVDMIAYTSADVVAQDAEVSINVYGEAEPRVYVARKCSGPNNTGVRMLVLKSGGGI